MPALALLAPLLLLAAAPASELEAGVRSEARVRGSQAAGAAALQPSLDFEIDPRASARLSWPTAQLSVAYAPRVTVPTTGRTLTRLLHRADLALEARTRGGLSLSLSERASYGDADLSPVSQALSEDPAALIETLPAGVTTVHYLSSQTRAGLGAALSRRADLSLSAGWLVSGGVDRAAQQAIPLQRGPAAELGLTLSLSRVDVLTTRLHGSSALFTTGLRTTLAGLEESWTRALSASWVLRLGAGIGVSDLRGGSGPATPGLQWLPVGEAGLAYKPVGRTGDLQGGLSVRASPLVDRITGEAYERVDARLAAGWAPRRELQLSAQAGAGVVASGARAGNTVALLEVSATLVTEAEWAVSLGVRAAHQTLPASFDEVGAFLAFSALARERL